jgi:hypothetical protein
MRILATHRSLFGPPMAPGARGATCMSALEITRVVEIFEAHGGRWALVGAHAVGLLTEPRATAGFDFIIEGAKLQAILSDLTLAFGPLGEHDIGAAMQLRAIDVDLIRSTNHPLFMESLAQVRTIGEWKVPRTEALVVLKFLAAVNPWRARNKRALDIADITSICMAVGAALDRELAIDLSRLVYPGAEREFRELLDKIDRGDPIAI